MSLARGSLDEVARWEYPDVGDHITSPAFAPRQAAPTPAGERARYGGEHPGGHDGHVVLPVLSDDGFRVEVFDAGAVGKGPVAVLAAPDRVCVPLVLHSAWMPRAVDPVGRDRLRFSDEVTDDALGTLGPELAGVVRDVAEELADTHR